MAANSFLAYNLAQGLFFVAAFYMQLSTIPLSPAPAALLKRLQSMEKKVCLKVSVPLDSAPAMPDIVGKIIKFLIENGGRDVTCPVGWIYIPYEVGCWAASVDEVTQLSDKVKRFIVEQSGSFDPVEEIATPPRMERQAAEGVAFVHIVTSGYRKEYCLPSS